MRPLPSSPHWPPMTTNADIRRAPKLGALAPSYPGPSEAGKPSGEYMENCPRLQERGPLARLASADY